MARQRSKPTPPDMLVDVVERLTVLEESLVNERWQKVADNFQTIDHNLKALDERVSAIERASTGNE